jgi:hypothetical protein
VFFTLALFMTEQTWRYDLPEVKYRDGLSMHRESGRVMLRNAVHTVEQRGDVPPIKYLQALAEREEEDQILPTYARAYELDGANPELAIGYGLHLFRKSHLPEARERFHDAVINAPDNALPVYLEAAAIAGSAQSGDALGEALALVARANAAGQEVVLPQVLWFPDLPKNCRAYANLMRANADLCAAPLYRLAERVLAEAPRTADAQGFEQADLYLLTLQDMGARLLDVQDQTATLTMAALRIQLDTVEERMKNAEKAALGPNDALVEKHLKLQSAIGAIAGFEQTRSQRIDDDQDLVTFPLLTLTSIASLLVVLAGFCLAVRFALWFLTPIISRDPSAATIRNTLWTIPIPRKALWVIYLCQGAMLFILVLYTISLRFEVVSQAWFTPIRTIWMGIIAGLPMFALLHPGFALPSAKAEAAQGSDDAAAPEILAQARSRRRSAWFVLSFRYVGMTAGLTLVVLCIWSLVFRIVMGAYPTLYVLVTTGLREEETAVVQQAINLLI